MPRAPSASAWSPLAKLKTSTMHMQRPSIDLSLTRHIGRCICGNLHACQRTVDPGAVMITHLRFFVCLYCRNIVFTLAELRRSFGFFLRTSFVTTLGHTGQTVTHCGGTMDLSLNITKRPG